MGKPKKKSGSQRHSAGNIDYDNLSGSQEAEDVPILHQHHQQQQQLQPSGFRGRSKTVGDATGMHAVFYSFRTPIVITLLYAPKTVSILHQNILFFYCIVSLKLCTLVLNQSVFTIFIFIGISEALNG